MIFGATKSIPPRAPSIPMFAACVSTLSQTRTTPVISRPFMAPGISLKLKKNRTKDAPAAPQAVFTSILQFPNILMTTPGYPFRILSQDMMETSAPERWTTFTQLLTIVVKQAVLMKLRTSFSIIVLLALCPTGPIPLRAQTIKRWTPAEIVAHAKPGQWVEVDGLIQKGPIVLAMEIEFRAGDFMDDDWRLLAKVSDVNSAKSELQVL